MPKKWGLRQFPDLRGVLVRRGKKGRLKKVLFCVCMFVCVWVGGWVVVRVRVSVSVCLCVCVSVCVRLIPQCTQVDTTSLHSGIVHTFEVP